MKKIVSLFFTTLIALTFVPSVLAQSAIDLAVTPPTAYLKIKPGSQASHTIVIENLGDQTLSVTPNIVDFTSDGVSGTPVLQQTHSFPYFDQATQTLSPVKLAPRSKAQLTLQAIVPQDAPNREYPLTVLFASSSSRDFSVGGTSAQVSGTIGSNVIILLSDETSPATDLHISSLQTSQFVDSFRSISFKPLVENNGYAASVASGSAHIRNWQGKIIQEFPLQPAIILGSSERELQPVSAENEVTAQLRYKPGFLFGIYTIEVILESPNEDTTKQISKTETIIALPIGVFLLILLTAVSIFVYKWHKNRQF